MSHRETQRYVDSEILSEYGCEHGYLLTSYHPYDYTDEEVEAVLKWWRDRPELIDQEGMDKLVAYWETVKVKRDEFYFGEAA